MRTIRILINESREFIGGYKKSYIPYNPITMAPLHTLSITHKDTAVETHRQGQSIIHDTREKCNKGTPPFSVSTLRINISP